jgi:hypothetical protein
MEGNAKQPVFANGRPVMIRLTRKQDGAVSEMPLNDTVLNFPIPKSNPGDEYRISVENLPAGYTVKSMLHDGIDMLTQTLQITKKDFVDAPIALLGGTLPGALLDIERIAYDAGAPMTTLEVTVSATSASGSATGVKVRGQIISKGSLELEVVPGAAAVLFRDRSFEITGVVPGRHVVLIRENGRNVNRVLGAIVTGSSGRLRCECQQGRYLRSLLFLFPQFTGRCPTMRRNLQPGAEPSLSRERLARRFQSMSMAHLRFVGSCRDLMN